MGVRGRPSFAELALRNGGGSITAVERPQAPAYLDEEARYEWQTIVDRLPAEWFPRETHPLLAAYCRHVVASRRVGQLIAEAEKAEQLDIRQYGELLKMQERESRAIGALATRMRLSQQSSYDHKKAKPAVQHVARPWGDT